MRPFLTRLKSRKFIMALLAAITAFIKAYYPDFPDQALYAVVVTCLGYIAAEGAIDFKNVNQGIDAAADLAKWTAGKKYEGTD